MWRSGNWSTGHVKIKRCGTSSLCLWTYLWGQSQNHVSMFPLHSLLLPTCSKDRRPRCVGRGNLSDSTALHRARHLSNPEQFPAKNQIVNKVVFVFRASPRLSFTPCSFWHDLLKGKFWTAVSLFSIPWGFVDTTTAGPEFARTEFYTRACTYRRSLKEYLTRVPDLPVYVPESKQIENIDQWSVISWNRLKGNSFCRWKRSTSKGMWSW